MSTALYKKFLDMWEGRFKQLELTMASQRIEQKHIKMESGNASQKKGHVLFWIATSLLALGMFSGGIGQLIRAKSTVEGFIHLGYPVYLTTLLGIWKVFGTIVILIPRFPLFKEWAYAGFFFAMSGAVYSHIASGDSFVHFMAPLIFAVLTVISWQLRPANRKLETRLNKSKFLNSNLY